MGTITAKTLIDSAANTLQDATNTRWSRAELLGYLNDGQRDVCIVKDDAYVLNQPVTLVAGTRQQLPANGTVFQRLVCNVANGVRGRAPRLLPLETLDLQNPAWHSAPASAIVLEYGYDARDPKRFYVSPPQPATPGAVEAVFSAVPPDIATENDAIALDDVYKTALAHYLLYRAYLKEGQLSDNASALAHRAEFLGLLGAKDTAELKAEAR